MAKLQTDTMAGCKRFSKLAKFFINSKLRSVNIFSRCQVQPTLHKGLKDFFSKCDQIRSFLRIWSHSLKKLLMENFIFCSVQSKQSKQLFILKTDILTETFQQSSSEYENILFLQLKGAKATCFSCIKTYTFVTIKTS